ncbi:MAG: hypothetical protein AVDCRST_MAG75-2452 [uncultured Propionibacteriaceae bacterium]|uniref:Uncharacterized protein n=1 Tax=uncultured Propionibacteriaceae bacterium TaxID=257457 RepID=A0A6J4P8B7_9ACTN|nr:MAG: hypothetical protein AVDCRST_MAG75-2452 [uncultured Propionibacteriaceae bacterium]
MIVLTQPIGEDFDVPDASFACPDQTNFTCLDELGLQVDGVTRRFQKSRAGVPGRRPCLMVSPLRLPLPVRQHGT